MLKHIRKFAVIVFFLIVILIVSFYVKSLNNEYVLDITVANTFYEISDGFVYFGRPTCPSCELFKPLLTEVAKEENIQVYYFNTDYFRNNSLLTEAELKEIFEKYQIQQVPILIKLVNGSLDSSFGANFIEEESGKIKEEIRDFVTYKELPIEYIPHYTIVIILFIISILIIVMLFLLKNKIKSKKIIFILLMTNISTIIILIFSIKPMMDYLEHNNLSKDPKMVILLLMTIVINLVSLIKLVIMYNKFQKREDGTEKSGSDTISEI
ncbi:thioredoxin family protein [Desulforamulus ruminis]|uniref:Thioredoxin n=1 Tax=Desulforamulus ruminis (strain ATCC 23193 / DSM 2154 / NCIMB 8452 / DL) TaxID=696281 RepID=F6DV19_DESRL|nr:thioredoxin family protein [Desulforamulus ruminis]AEG61416.1 hypothetical protein Desru_3207 [Desulforamulus ruminis DSM 2154]